MSRDSHGVGDSTRRRDDHLAETKVGKAVPFRLMTRTHAVLLALFLLAPLIPMGGSGPDPTLELHTGHSALVEAVAITETVGRSRRRQRMAACSFGKKAEAARRIPWYGLLAGF